MQNMFMPNGNSLLVAVSTVANIVQVSTGDIYGFRVVNFSTSDIYIATGVSTATATYPSTAGSASMLISGKYNGPEYIRTSGQCFLSAISTVASVAGQLQVTPGIVM